MSSVYDPENRKDSPNRLISEKSPYLLQHAYNPVNWYPWSREAFEDAQKQNKPIFLSIGYSTCHWCHVMEKESFEDKEVAALMNEAFIPIKVDREERPDIDTVYMKVCQLMTGSGGWPLTVIMTPDKKPFFAGTYLPKESRFGRIGMLDLVPRIKRMWAMQHDDILKLSHDVTAALRREEPALSADDLDESVLQTAYEELSGRFDEQYGGFGTAPKFPTPHNLLFLLRYWKRKNEPRALEMVEKTLLAMRQGGMYDHVGYGFHRYSTDLKWLVPHFEKMLYDQALLAMVYTDAYLATKNHAYRETACEILDYVLRDMTAPEGGFYSAEDADSEGEEGKFYVWSIEELYPILDPSDADLFIKVFNVAKEGNFVDQVTGESPGTNILHLSSPLERTAGELHMPQQVLREKMQAALQKLFVAREKRMHPHKDDKILTDWNGLMIMALARAAQSFDRPDYASAAEKATAFVLKHLRTPEGRLIHRYRDGEASLTAHVDDYAFFISALIDLYEAVFDSACLETAIELNRDFIQHFWDWKQGGFYFTADDAEEILVRGKEIYDAAVPSGNSMAMLNLLRLGQITGDPDLEKKALDICRAFSGALREYPAAYTQLLVAADYALGPSYEVVVAGDSGADDTKAMLRAVMSRFLPHKVLLLRPAEQKAPDIDRISGFTQYHESPDGKATAYICRDRNCLLPTSDIGKMLEILND
ncbi:MAG: thioredoxin domain protein [Nitrospirae bacterium]|nr:thioredoxin domain protein [Nitrospirota bacterium]